MSVISELQTTAVVSSVCWLSFREASCRVYGRLVSCALWIFVWLLYQLAALLGNVPHQHKRHGGIVNNNNNNNNYYYYYYKLHYLFYTRRSCNIVYSYHHRVLALTDIL